MKLLRSEVVAQLCAPTVCVHTLSIYSRERRASAKVTHNVGTIMTKKFYSIFFKKSRVQGSALGTYRHALTNGLFSPSLDQESSRNLSRGSRYGERGSMPLSPYLSELVTTDSAVTGTTWAGTALTGFRSVTSGDCPVDSSRRTKPQTGVLLPSCQSFTTLQVFRTPTWRPYSTQRKCAQYKTNRNLPNIPTQIKKRLQ